MPYSSASRACWSGRMCRSEHWKALTIAAPRIGCILDGCKTWEMRSNAVSHRGRFGPIRKGTGAVHGVARLVDTDAPLSPDDMVRSGEAAKGNIPWIPADVQRLSSPVHYQHRGGAVTRAELGAEVSGAIARQLRDPFEATPDVREALSWTGNMIERFGASCTGIVTHNRFPARLRALRRGHRRCFPPTIAKRVGDMARHRHRQLQDHSAPRRRVSLVEEGTTQTVVGLIW